MNLSKFIAGDTFETILKFGIFCKVSETSTKYYINLYDIVQLKNDKQISIWGKTWVLKKNPTWNCILDQDLEILKL